MSAEKMNGDAGIHMIKSSPVNSGGRTVVITVVVGSTDARSEMYCAAYAGRLLSLDSGSCSVRVGALAIDFALGYDAFDISKLRELATRT
eukprot:8721671-Heterocapsa_arctica.AAC.1